MTVWRLLWCWGGAKHGSVYLTSVVMFFVVVVLCVCVCCVCVVVCVVCVLY